MTIFTQKKTASFHIRNLKNDQQLNDWIDAAYYTLENKTHYQAGKFYTYRY